MIRAFAGLLLLALASWAMPAEASCTVTNNNASCTTLSEAAAYSPPAIGTSKDGFCASNKRPAYVGARYHNTVSNRFEWYWNCAGNSTTPSGAFALWAFASYSTNDCLSQPPLGSLVVKSASADIFLTCSGGCEYIDPDSTTESFTVEGQLYVRVTGWESTGNRCTAASTADPLIPPERPDADSDGVPDDEDAFPSDPGESADSDGDGLGDNGDVAPNDAGNGEDGSSEELPTDGPGNETDNRAEGGGTCDAPPTCSGDGIQCNSLYQTWRTRCAIERAQASDGTLKISGTGTGGAVAVAGSGGGDDSNAGMFDDLKNGPDGVSETDAGSVWGPESTFTPDEAGWGFSRSCPAPPTITLAGMSRTLDTVALCDLAEIIGALVLLMAAAHAFFALAKG